MYRYAGPGQGQTMWHDSGMMSGAKIKIPGTLTDLRKNFCKIYAQNVTGKR